MEVLEEKPFEETRREMEKEYSQCARYIQSATSVECFASSGLFCLYMIDLPWLAPCGGRPYGNYCTGISTNSCIWNHP